MKILLLLIYSMLAPIIIIGQYYILTQEKSTSCLTPEFEQEEICYKDGTCEQIK